MGFSRPSKEDENMRTPLGLLLLALVAHTGTASAQTWSPEQQEIWRLEDQSWKMGAAKDLTWIDTMVHPNISFWEISSPAPQNKASLSRWAKYGSTASTVLEYEIFPISVTITGNVAVAQYSYLVASENYKKERETVTGRWTDVFIKEDGRWLFIAFAGGEDPKKN
jgi:ketosteroid isomerase-like protein